MSMSSQQPPPPPAEPSSWPQLSQTPRVIRTPDRRLRVFISSTLQELAPERAAAREAVLRLRLAPVMFELGARPHPPRDLYRAYLAQSDLFVGIYWQRYGWVAPEMTISGLEDEYLLSAGLPRLIYLKRPAPEQEPRLRELLERIRADDTASYRSFATPEELRELLENDLALVLTERFELGQLAAQLAVQQSAPAQLPAPLPVPRSRLVGREQELQQMQERLLDETAGLVTLTGPGGTGKTRLALEAAGRLRTRFRDGVVFVPLAAVRDPGHVLLAIAQALGVRESATQPVATSLKDFLRDRHLLLVLDNFEQVVDAAPQVIELLETCPGLKVLATSRTALRVRGEHELSVQPLPLPERSALARDPVAQLDVLAQSAAVALFVQRVREVRPDFTLTSENAGAVAEICRRLDGLPLAIELAAARCRMFTPQALLARLERRLPLLTGGARDLPARQQTMRAAIAWSYDLLSQPEQALFRRLAVFAGGCTLHAAEAVCQGNHIATEGGSPGAMRLPPLSIDLLDGIESLLAKSLLQHDADSPSLDGEPRFSMLATIREFGLERLDAAGEAVAAGRAHAAYYLAVAEEADRQMPGPQEPAWLDRLEQEHDNLRAALAWCLQTATDAAAQGGREDELDTAAQPAASVLSPTQLGLRLAAALRRFWLVRSHFREGRQWLEQVLALPGAQGYTAERARALLAAGILARPQGDYTRSEVLLRESLAIQRELGNKPEMAAALNNLGILALLQEHYPQARALLEESIAVRQGLGDQAGMVGPRNNLGLVALCQGDYLAAQRAFGENLAYVRAQVDRRGMALALSNLALVALHQEAYETAAPLLRESLQLFWEVRDDDNIAALFMGLGAVAASRGGFQRSAKLWGAAEAVREAIGAPLLPIDRAYYERALAMARAALDGATWTAAWSTGRALPLEQAVAYALAQGPEHIDG